MSIFDEMTVRRGTGSYKWDSASYDDVIPLWVADMDFRTAPVVQRALERRVAQGIFGYTLVTPDYYEALTHWFREKHSYHLSADRVIYTSGVVPAISAIIKALVKPGEGVIVQTPVYNCFFSSIRNNGCMQVDSPLLREDLPDGRFTYTIDFDDLEEKAARPEVKMLLLCNPHNPAGRLWTEPELSRIAEICRENSVIVVSDEIHNELTEPGTEYVAYGPIDAEVNDGHPTAVVCLSPSKAFNIAGLQIANIVCPDAETQSLIDKAINQNEVCDVNPFGVEALKAAYTPEGEEWLEELRGYLWDNYRMLCERFTAELPECPVSLLEATYLPWIDVSALSLGSEEMEHRLVEEARVWVNCGDMYGEGGYLRINIACPRERLSQGLDRLIPWLREHLG